MVDKLKTLEINMVELNTNLKNFGKKLDDHIVDQKDDIKAIKDTINDFIKEADKKYAPMWVADGLKWAIRLVVAGVILTILSYIGFKSYYL